MTTQLPSACELRMEFLQFEESICLDDLTVLVADKESRVRFWAARRPELNDELIALLRDDPSVGVRLSLIVNPDVPLERPAEVLAVDDDVLIRRCLARRPGVGVSILEVLVTDSDLAVRSFVARNADLSEELARVLVDDEWSVQVSLLNQFGRWSWLDDRLRSSDDECLRGILEEIT